MADTKTIYAALMGVQQSLKAPKDKDGGGRYKYRSAEDILEKVKPLLQDAGLILLLDEEIRTDNVGSYIYSTATIVDIATGDTLSTHSMAREDLGTKVMSPGQATGAAISYARKYCLGGLFLIDNEDDLDSPAYQAKSKPPANANGAQDSMKQAALKGLNERVKALGVSPEAVTNIIHRQYNKANSKEMTTNEVADLANNLKKFIDMGMGA
jgi:hypothetical protein